LDQFMKVLLTGFEPFGPVRVNPSEQIVRRIGRHMEEETRSREAIDLRAEVLPTEFAAADRRIRHWIRQFRPDAVLCLGVAPQRDKISLERFALNMDDDSLPDNAGRRRAGRRIAPNGPPAYWSTLPLERIRKQLERQGIPVSYSNHAGTYLCNHIFYVARQEIERLGNGAPCGFVHVPPARTRGKKARGLGLETMVEAVEYCLEVLRKG
jgi:pyroglutamyl-peptidase